MLDQVREFWPYVAALLNVVMIVGSPNWDPRSPRLNFEFNLDSRELATSLSDLARSKMQHSRPVTLADLDG